MIPKEVFQKIRRIEITTKRLVTDVFAGQYHSVFKGRGMEFDEVREYTPGDDIRTIDWNVTARTGKVHIKKYVEERELTVMILVDASSSCQFGTVKELKSQLAAEIAAALAFSAIRNSDKVGLIIFTDRVEKFIPARKGLTHVLHVIREVLYFKPEGKLTDIVCSLEFLTKVMTRKTVSFVISDFFSSQTLREKALSKEEDVKKALSIANKRHDIIAVTLNDPRESSLADCGLVELEDAETGEVLLVDSADRKIRNRFHDDSLRRLRERDRLFDSIGVDHIDISTDKPYTTELIKFFLKRRHRLA